MMHSQALMVSCSRRLVLPCERASPCVAAKRGARGMEQVGRDRSREMMRMRTMGMRSRKRARRTVSRGAATEKVTSALTNSGSVFGAASSSRDSVIENGNQWHATKRIIQCESKWNMCRNRRVFSISRATSKGFSSTDNVPLSDKV